MKMLKKATLLAALFGCTFAVSAHADTAYVTDQFEITLRSGPTLNHRIQAFLQSGQRVEVIEAGSEWSHVRDANGKEGWVLSRYLTSSPTHDILLARLQNAHANLRERLAALQAENTQLKAQNQKLQSALADKDTDLTQLRNRFETLKKESAEFLSLKSKYETSAARLAQQTEKAESLEARLSKLGRDRYIRWFLAGAGVLFVGFMLGFMVKRQRRRPSLL